jgi:hypothetical protein
MEQMVVRDDAEKWYVSYAFLRQSGNQHGNLKVDLQNDFTTGDNPYPKNLQQTLHLLDKYINTAVAKVTQSEGTSIAQRSERGAKEETDAEVKVVTKKAMTISISNIERTRLATSVRRRGTLYTSALRSQTMTMLTKL